MIRECETSDGSGDEDNDKRQKQEPSRWSKWRRRKKMKVKHCDKYNCQHTSTDTCSPDSEPSLQDIIQTPQTSTTSKAQDVEMDENDLIQDQNYLQQSSSMPAESDELHKATFHRLQETHLAVSSSDGIVNTELVNSNAETLGVFAANNISDPVPSGESDIPEPAHKQDESSHHGRYDYLESSDDDCEFEVRFLDEEPEGGPEDGSSSSDDENPDNPDPDPDGDPDDIEGELEDSDSSADEDTFDFQNEELNAPLRASRGRSVREALLLTLATSIRHNHTYEALLDSFRALNILHAGQPFPKSKKKLWRIVNRKGSGITMYAYCNRCLRFLGKKENLVENFNCVCGFQIQPEKVKWFASLSLRKQLKHFLSFPGVANLLNYPNTRDKRNPQSVDDIFDGERYQQLVAEGEIVPGERTYTYVFNTDSFRVGKKGKVSASGLLVRLNELPPGLRQKYLFLAGIWVDRREPRMNTFFRPFVHQGNRLSSRGVRWKPDGVNEIRSRFLPLCMCVDSKVRYAALNMTQYNGEYGCTTCTHKGVQFHGSRYPVLPYEDLPAAVLRTHDSIIWAINLGVPFEGQKGPSELMMLDYYRMCALGNAMDSLHPFFEGVAAFHTELLVALLDNEAIEILDRRLLRIKSHTSIARKPTSIRNIGQWKGTDWRNWLLYYGVPCLLDLIPQYHLHHFELLSHAAFLLSRDSIEPGDFDVAQDKLTRYEVLFQQYHGVENMRYNIHIVCKHSVQSVKNFGPLWTVSTFNFESWNHTLQKTITSPHGIIDQIVTRHLMKLHVNVALHSDLLSDNVKFEMANILRTSERRVRAEAIAVNIHVIGTPTMRPATLEEMQLILNANVNCVGDLSLYDRVIFKGIEYRCAGYHPDTRSDNSLIYTEDDWFGTINTIVSFRNEANQIVCGAFVHQHEVMNPFINAVHFVQIEGEGDSVFIILTRIRQPAIKITVRDSVYIVPMGNTSEID